MSVLSAADAEPQPRVGTKIECASNHGMNSTLRAGNPDYVCKKYFDGTTLSSYEISNYYSSTFHILGHPEIGQDDFILPVGSNTPDSATGKSY